MSHAHGFSPTLPKQPAPIPMHPDTRASEALHSAIQAAWTDGHGRGEWAGHLKGWRSGVVCGLCWGVLLTAIAAGCAHHLGWL